MAERFEYEVVNLKPEHDGTDKRHFRWHCKRRSDCVDQTGLESLLNDLGRDGWSVVAFDTDARFGSQLVLQRAVDEGTVSPPGRRARAVASPATTAAVEMAVGELRALRADLAQREPMDAALRLQEEQRRHQAEEADRHLHSEAFKEALAPVLDELKAQRKQTPVTLDEGSLARLEAAAQRPESPSFPQAMQAVVDPEAFKVLEETVRLAIERSQAAPTVAVLDPESIKWLEEALASRDDREEPPSGPAVAVLGDDATAQLGQVLREAGQEWVRSLPVPRVSVQAMIDPSVLAPLSATLDPQALYRLEESIRLLAARPVAPATAMLAEETADRIGTALRRAVDNLPAPQVRATIEQEALVELRESLLAAAALLPAPEVSVSVTAQLAPEAVQQLTAALTAALSELKSSQSTTVVQTLDDRAVARVEAAVVRAVDAVFAASEEEIEPVFEPSSVPASWWSWPQVSQRLRLAFGR